MRVECLLGGAAQCQRYRPTEAGERRGRRDQQPRYGERQMTRATRYRFRRRVGIDVPEHGTSGAGKSEHHNKRHAEHDLGPWLAWATVLHGWALAMRGQEEGVAQARQGAAGWGASGALCLQPYFLGLLAEAQRAIGQTEMALATLREALAITEQTREGLAESELQRLKGELVLASLP